MATPPGFYSPVDQAIYSAGDFFIPTERFRAAPYNVNTPTAPDDPAAAGLPVIYQSQGGGGGGAYTGGIDDLIRNYELDTRNQYFGSQPTPLVNDLRQSKLDKTFMGFPSYREIDPIGPFTPYNQPMDINDPGASIENIIASRNVPLELTTAGKIQQGLGSFKDKVSDTIGKVAGFGPVSAILGSMDKFDTLSPADQQFIKMNMGYTGPTVFGENTSGLSKDPYGINTRSAFGNYADYVEGYNTDYTDEELAKMSKFRQQKIAYYKQKQQELKEIKERKEAEARAEAQAIQDRNRAARTGGYQAAESSPGAGDGYDSGFMEGSGTAAEMGSFMDGGIVDLVDIYD